MSSRRFDELALDHGAQYFTARNPDFAAVVRQWVDAGLVAEWEARYVRVGPDGAAATQPASPRYVGVPRMSGVGRALANGLDALSQTRVESIEPSKDGGWTLRSTEGEDLGSYRQVLVAVPSPQALPLIESVAPSLHARVAQVEMAPCLAAMLVVDGHVDVEWDAAKVEVGPLAWVARNSSKPGRVGAETWVLHAGEEHSRVHLGDSFETIADTLLGAFAELPGVGDIHVTQLQGHRWGHARVARPLGEPCLYDTTLGLGLCGDWCTEGRVEAAWLSGRALARRVGSR